MRKMLPDRPPESMFAIEILDEKSFIQTETKHIHTQTFSPRDLVLDSPMRVRITDGDITPRRCDYRNKKRPEIGINASRVP